MNSWMSSTRRSPQSNGKAILCVLALCATWGPAYAELGPTLLAQAVGTEVIDATAVTAARAAGSPEFDKAKEEAPAYQFGLTYKGDYLRGTNGVFKSKSAYRGNLDLTLAVAGDKAFNIPGSSAFVHVLHDHGGHIDSRVQSQQGVDNIETSVNSAKLHQLWWQQQFLDDKLSLLGGLYDLNSEFYVTESSGVYINPSFGIGADAAQSGDNGPSIFPNSGLGLRIRGQLTEQAYAQFVVLDGVPGDPQHPKGTHVKLGSGDGALFVGELGYRATDEKETDKTVTKFAFGAWRYTKKADDLVDVDGNGDPVKRTNQGFYAVVEHQLFKHEDGRRVMGFARYGVANKDVNGLKDNLALGLTLQGPCSSRAEDVFGIAMTRVAATQKAQDAALAAGDPVVKNETIYELTYQAKINDWLKIQPEVQYIKTSQSPARNNDLLVGVRFEVGLKW